MRAWQRLFLILTFLLGIALSACGIDPAEIIGTWTYDEGTSITFDCENDDKVSVFDLTGQTLTFENGSGTPYDLVVNIAPGCDLGYNIEGHELVLVTTMVEGCYTDPTSSALLNEGLRMTIDGDKILLSGSPTITVQTPDEPDGYDCLATLSGSMTKNTSQE